MTSVWTALGYNDVVGEIALSLQRNDDIVVVEGPPGIGKSWLAKGVGAFWEAGSGAAVVAEGDRVRSDVPFYALGFAMARLSSGWRTLTSPAVEMARSGESLAGTGGIIASTVQVLSQLRPRARRARSMFLGEAEQEILFDLERIADGRPLLLIADNLHWWDRQSLEFVGRLRHPEMVSAFPFLASLRIVAALTSEPYQTVSHPVVVDALLRPQSTRYFSLGRITRKMFADALIGLGAEARPDDTVVDAIFALTGGHLALARRCVAELEDDGGQLFVDAVDSSEFVARLLTERLQSLGTVGSEAVELLQIAAVLGLRFRRDEVACAWGEDRAQTSRVLRHLRDEEMVELSEESGAFVHELYREHFLNATTFDRVAVHERLVDCLRRLSPGDYELRAQNSSRAERPSEAGTLAVLAGLALVRDGSSTDQLSDETKGLLEQQGQVATLEQFGLATDELDREQYSDCLARLDRLPRTLPEPLSAEADYLRAKCLMQTRSKEQRALARSILDTWDRYEEQEPEIGVRLMLQKLFGLSALVDKTQAREYESRLKAVLRQRARFDKSAEDAMYTLDRCCPSLYPADIAFFRVRDATDYYRPAAGRTVLRRPNSLYLALVNLASQHVANARYPEALNASREIGALVESFPTSTFPRVDLPRGTALLAEHRLGLISPQNAVTQQTAIIEEHGVEGDPFYPKNALAIYLALAGRYLDSIAIFDDLIALIGSRREPEASMEYMLRANAFCVRFVASQGATDTKSWTELGKMVPEIPWPGNDYYVRRHDLLGEVIASDLEWEPATFDRVLIDTGRPQLGPMWDQVGRGFLLPEVEWWH